MAPSAAVNKIARELRSAIAAGDHATAGRLLPRYSQALQSAWESLSPQERAASPLPQQTRELLEWARSVAIIQRALSAEQLATLQKAGRYCAPESSPAFQVRG